MVMDMRHYRRSRRPVTGHTASDAGASTACPQVAAPRLEFRRLRDRARAASGAAHEGRHPSNPHLPPHARPGVPSQGGSDAEATGRPNPGTASSARNHMRRPVPLSGVTCNAPSHHAPDARSRRPFRPPDPLLESQDGAVHLRRARQDPHHQPRKDAAAVHRRDELHLGARAEARHHPVRRHQALGARRDEGRSRALRHAVHDRSAGSAAC